MQHPKELVEIIQHSAHRVSGAGKDYNTLMERIGDARFVLLGEASHGTQDFYRERAQITKRLIREKGFTAVAVEADWPDAYRVNRYVRGMTPDAFAIEALADFRRFPRWMWRNTEAAQFVDWLREYNDAQPPQGRKAGFYGMDLYSLHSSMDAVLRFLEAVDPGAAAKARERYSCFDHFGDDAQVYGFLAGTGVTKTCQEQVVSQLLELQRDAMRYVQRDPRVSADDAFFAEQNARLVKNAEAYYRTMFLREESSWNLRDRHMAETLEALAEYLGSKAEPAKIVVWAHNSHLGDARATEMGPKRGELNVGQLVRERYGKDKTVLVGFTTHHGTVTAASDWGGPAERKAVRPSLGESYEAVFHASRVGRFFLVLQPGEAITHALRDSRLERAIGVIYRPETERASHYFEAHLSDQFDAVIHIEKSLAVEPLERNSEWVAGEAPETYPFGV
jgi:erythromycin esterase-like protein